jgi:hypothetical protein
VDVCVCIYIYVCIIRTYIHNTYTCKERDRIMSGGSAASRCAMMLERLVRFSCVCVCVYFTYF